MTRIRRGGYVFMTWVGDHPPKHIHVYRDGKLVLTWDIQGSEVLAGEWSPRIVSLIRELQSKGRL
jgi:hypothetical protein